MLQSDSDGKQPSTPEEEMIAAILQRILEGWPYHREYIHARGGEIRITFPPGIGQVNLVWPVETVKKSK